MKKNIFNRRFVACFIVLLVTLVCSASSLFAAGQLREVMLKDGSILKAEIISFTNGVYSLRSETMGDFQLEDDAIQSIRLPADGGHNNNVSSNNSDPAESPKKEEINEYQQSLLTNPGLIGMVFSLQNDPEVQRVLQDEEVMALILSGKTKDLESNPKFIKLMENPKIRAILDQMDN